MEELCQLTYVPIPPAFLCAIFMLLTTYNNSFLHNLNTYLVSNMDTGSLIIGGDWNVTPGGGGLPYESDGDARRKIRINTLKETNLGVAPALFNP